MFAYNISLIGVNETPPMIMYGISLLLVMLALVVLFGKGDFLISGYNTASEEEKAKYNMPRLRLLVSSMVIFVSIGISVAAFLEFDEVDMSVFAAVVVALSVVSTFLTRTWVKKK